MGGNKQQKEIEVEVSNELSMMITNNNKTVTKMMNDTAINVSNNIVNENVSKVKMTTSSSNKAKLTGISVGGSGNKVTIEQQAKAEAINKAAAMVSNDNQAMSDIANKTQEQILSKISNDNDVKAALSQTAQISDSIKDNGGVEGVIKKAMEAISSMGIANESKESIKQKISTKMNINLTNNNYNETDIKKSFQTNIQNNLKSITEQGCDIYTSASNELEIDQLKVFGSGNEFNMSQIANVKALNDCIQSALNSNSVVQKATGISESDMKFFQETANKVAAEAKQEYSKKTEKIEEGSTIGDIIDKAGDAFAKNNPLVQFKELILYGIIGVGAIIAIVVIAKALGGSKGSSGGDEEEYDEDQEGGGPGNHVNTILIIIVTVLVLNIFMNRKC